MADRIASFSQTGQLVKNNMRVESKYAESQVQASTGLKSDTYEGIAKDSSKILNLESDYSRIVMQTENAQTALERSDATYDAMGTIFNVGQTFLSNLNAAISGTGAEAAQLAEIAQSNLEQTEAALNAELGGRFLFSGSATNTPPVDINDPTFGGQTFTAPGPSVTDTGYYQGNDFIHSVEAADSLTVEYGVLASDPAFEEIMRAYDLVRTTPGDPDTLNEALRLLQNGLDALAVAQAEVSQSSQVLDRQINENLDKANLIDNMIVDLKEVDLAEVSVRLQELQTQLEASYSVTADLLRLSLTDYI